jgi:hypothetical protein
MKRIVPRRCDTGQCLPCRLLAGAVGWAARCPAIMKARSGPGGRRLCLLSSARGLVLPAKVYFASSPSPSIAPPNSLWRAGRQNSADLSARFTRCARSARRGDSLRALWPPGGEGPERFRCPCCQEPSHRSADRCRRSTGSGAEHLMIWPRSPDTTCHSLSGHRIPKSGVVVCQCALRSGGQGRSYVTCLAVRAEFRDVSGVREEAVLRRDWRRTARQEWRPPRWTRPRDSAAGSVGWR